MKIGSICSGMGMALHGLGDRVWGIEYDPAIADIYQANHGLGIICSPVEKISPDTLEDVDCIVATPSCIRASKANYSNSPKTRETSDDLSVAWAIANIISRKLPKFFILENVPGYKTFESYNTIIKTLYANQYYVRTQKLNLKNFGIAQSRDRIYVMAVRNGFFMDIVPPNKNMGWYEAIADIVDTLPDTKLTSWQHPVGDCLFRRCGANKSNNRLYAPHEPVFTIRAYGRKAGGHWHQADISIGGNFKALTPQAELRFFGDKKTADKIKLPTSKALASEVVGNGASWEIMQILLNHMVKK
jgi:site-specific DNA-cytosine methylase